MAQAAQTRVETEIKGFVNGVDQRHLRGMEKRMHECAAQCCGQTQIAMDEVHGCVEKCQGDTLRAQRFVQDELARFQDSLSRCVTTCQETVKDKVTPESSEADITSLRGTFEKCAIQCCDTNLARLPDIGRKIDATFKSGQY
eukprot:snap_masked-scaffold1226_size54525-processed-gene-0.6 protein:Tk01312 transcript:snap_masked-scaffold1226_size54525-processed-gene-0.6-mRNA-1 annotation:"FAM136A"